MPTDLSQRHTSVFLVVCFRLHAERWCSGLSLCALRCRFFFTHLYFRGFHFLPWILPPNSKVSLFFLLKSHPYSMMLSITILHCSLYDEQQSFFFYHNCVTSYTQVCVFLNHFQSTEVQTKQDCSSRSLKINNHIKQYFIKCLLKHIVKDNDVRACVRIKQVIDWLNAGRSVRARVSVSVSIIHYKTRFIFSSSYMAEKWVLTAYRPLCMLFLITHNVLCLFVILEVSENEKL